jgi:hypothetical protein
VPTIVIVVAVLTLGGPFFLLSNGHDHVCYPITIVVLLNGFSGIAVVIGDAFHIFFAGENSTHLHFFHVVTYVV